MTKHIIGYAKAKSAIRAVFTLKLVKPNYFMLQFCFLVLLNSYY